MDNHELGILLFLLLGIAIVALPTAGNAGESPPPEPMVPEGAAHRIPARDLLLSIVAFGAAVLFAAAGIFSELAGAHWLVGVVCVAGSLSFTHSCLKLHGLNLFRLGSMKQGESR